MYRSIFTSRDVVCCVFVFLFRPSVSAKLPEPEIVATEVISPSEIQIRWHDPDLGDKQKVKDKRFYSIKYYIHQKRGEKFERSKVKDTETVIDSLLPNTTYVFRVKVIKGKRASTWSKTAVNRTYSLETYIQIEATTLTSRSVILAWTLPRQHVSQTDEYTLYWSEEDQEVKFTKVKATVRSHVFHDLVPGRVYSFRLVSRSGSNGVMSTATVFATTYTDRPSKPPRDIRLKVIGPKLVRMTWSPPPVRKRHGQITHYKVQYKRRGSRRGDVCTVITSSKPREYDLTDVVEGATYRVRIAAKTANGTGPYSKWDSIDIPVSSKADRKSRMTFNKGQDKRKGLNKSAIITSTTATTITTTVTTTTSTTDNVVPEIPGNLHVFNVSSTRIGLRWLAPPPKPCCPVVAYRLLVSVVKANQLERDVVTGTSTETVIDGLDPGVEYAINISAFNTQGPSNQSDNIYVTTSPAVTPKVVVRGDTVLVGGRANLTCDVTGDPIPNVDWYRDGKAAPYYKQQSLNMIVHTQLNVLVMRQMYLPERKISVNLILDSVTPKNAGKYVCSAHYFDIGTINKTVELHVHALPSFVRVDKRHGVVGKATSMSCLVTGIPLPDVQWSRYKDGLVFNETRVPGSRMYVTTSVDEIQRVVNKTLHFSTLNLSDEGNYTCQAKKGDYSTWRIVPLTLEVPLPPPVSNIRALAVSPSRVSIIWDDPVGYSFPITAYNLVYSNDRTRRQTSVNTTQRHLEIDDLQPSKIYKVKVRAYNTHGVGEMSREIQVTTLPRTNLQPANVSAVALNSSVIQLDWEVPGTIDPMYIQGFNIYYMKVNASRQEKLFIAGNRNKQFLIGLGKEDTFYLKISTVLTWGEEAPSQWIKIKKNILERKPPPPPRRLHAIPAADSIQLTWRQPLIAAGQQGPEVKVRGYKIRYGLTDMRNRRVKELQVSGRTMSYTLKQLAPGQLYRVAVRAYNEYGHSRAVTMDTRTKDVRPGPVIGAIATPMSSTQILVQWLEPKRGPVTRYHVRYWRPGKRDKQSAWLYSPNTQYIAGSLRKHSQYRFDIIPYNNQQIGEVVIIHADTMIDLPDAPPKTVNVVAVNATALRVHWEPPPKPSQNGPITGYKLVLKMKTGKRLASFSVDGSRRNYTFKNLEPSMPYKVRVAAMTAKGTGPSSKWVIQTTDKIQLRAPESPAAMDTNVTSTTIHVTWQPPRDIGVPVLGYIVGYGRYIPEVYRQVLGPTVSNFTLTKLALKCNTKRVVTSDVLDRVFSSSTSLSLNTKTIVYLEADTGYIVSVRAYNHFGESLPKFVVGKTKQVDPGELPIKLQLKMRAEALSVSEIKITWFSMTPDLQKQLDSSIYFLVRFSALEGSEYQYINISSIPVTIGNLRKGTKYEFSVKALRGSKETEWSLPVYNSTYDTVPAAPYNITVTPDPKKHTTLTLTWMAPLDDEVDEYIVYSTRDSSQNVTLWEKTNLPGSRDMMRVQELMPYTTYYFHIQARNKAGYGPLSERVTYTPFSEPESAPSNVNVHPLHGNKSTTVEVTWSGPERHSDPVTDYMIYYTSHENVSHTDWTVKSEPSLSCLLIGLDYNATYRIEVRARYSDGRLGPASPVTVYKTLSYSDIEQSRRQRKHRIEAKVTSQSSPTPTNTVTFIYGESGDKGGDKIKVKNISDDNSRDRGNKTSVDAQERDEEDSRITTERLTDVATDQRVKLTTSTSETSTEANSQSSTPTSTVITSGHSDTTATSQRSSSTAQSITESSQSTTDGSTTTDASLTTTDTSLTTSQPDRPVSITESFVSSVSAAQNSSHHTSPNSSKQ